MPYSVTKSNGGYRVTSPHGTKAKHTTKAKAEAQVRLLRGVEHGWKPTGKKPSKKKPSKEMMYQHALEHGGVSGPSRKRKYI